MLHKEVSKCALNVVALTFNLTVSATESRSTYTVIVPAALSSAGSSVLTRVITAGVYRRQSRDNCRLSKDETECVRNSCESVKAVAINSGWGIGPRLRKK